MLPNLTGRWTVLLLLFTIGFTSCDDDEDTPAVPVIGTITDIAASDPQFSTLVSALERTGLDATLNIFTGRFTVFAPTNDAFAASGINLDNLSDDELTNVLLYHVISGSVIRSTDINEGLTEAGSANTTGPGGSALPLFVERSGSTITVNDANITAADIEGVNGVIHVIDAVLLPPSIVDRAVRDGRFTTLVTALQRTGLDATLAAAGDFTVFAPTDDAFAAAGINLDDLSNEALTNVLLYHVIGASVTAGDIADGQSYAASLNATGPNDSALSLGLNKSANGVFVNGETQVLIADVVANNGVIHAVNRVLSPQTIVDFVVANEGLSDLTNALTAADLVGALSGTDALTVFAPDNDAFAAIADVVAGLTPGQLSQVLTYHVVAGNVRAENITPGPVPTLNTNANFTLSLEDGAQIIDAAGNVVNITATDIQGTNGVIHLVESVLIPFQ